MCIIVGKDQGVDLCICFVIGERSSAAPTETTTQNIGCGTVDSMQGMVGRSDGALNNKIINQKIE